MDYSIRNVIELSGASEFLLRVWENRYQAFSPKRTKTGRRLYSTEDIIKARALVQLTERGLRVGKIAHLPVKSLQKILEEPVVQRQYPINSKIKKVMEFAHRYQWREIRSIFLSERAKLGCLNWINKFVLPLLHEIARQSDSGQLEIPKERILVATIEENLLSLRTRAQRSKVKFAFATQEGDFHDLALRIAHVIANHHKIESLFLGAHIPKRELSEVCLKSQITHLVLSSTPAKAVNKNDFLRYIQFLDSNLPSQVTIWVAGRNALAHDISLQRNFLILKSFDHYQEQLKDV